MKTKPTIQSTEETIANVRKEWQARKAKKKTGLRTSSITELADRMQQDTKPRFSDAVEIAERYAGDKNSLDAPPNP